MKVDCDLQLTLMASSLYRLLAGQIGRGYEQAKSRHLFRDFVDATAKVTDRRVGDRRPLPETRSQPFARGSGLRPDRDGHPVAGR